MKIKKGMILAAGFGKRLQPLTKNCPKPLLEVHGIKLLEYSIKFLLDNGISEIIINTSIGPQPPLARAFSRLQS